MLVLSREEKPWGLQGKKNPGDLVPYLFGGDDGTPPLLQHLSHMFLGTSGNSRKRC